jgi:shikimate dehydrogenase
MHTAGYRRLGIDATYELLKTPPDQFPSVEAELRKGTLNGVNVTMPHKGNAFAAADVVDETVDRLKAVNTLVASDGVLTGFNTDIEGVIHALATLDLPSDTPVHVLGSGGAAAAAILATEGERLVSIAGRSQHRVGDLRRQLRVSAAIVPWDALPQSAIVVNATPLGMHGESLPAGVLAAATGLIDMAYGDEPTPAVLEADRMGIPYADGLVMLAGQAAEAFRLFTGHRVPADIMETAARTS